MQGLGICKAQDTNAENEGPLSEIACLGDVRRSIYNTSVVVLVGPLYRPARHRCSHNDTMLQSCQMTDLPYLEPVVHLFAVSLWHSQGMTLRTNVRRGEPKLVLWVRVHDKSKWYLVVSLQGNLMRDSQFVAYIRVASTTHMHFGLPISPQNIQISRRMAEVVILHED